MTVRPIRCLITAALIAGALSSLAACGAGQGTPPGTIPVEATDDACKVTPTTAPAGSITFAVTNKGTKITEFYLYGPDDKVISEVEGIGAGITRTMTLQVQPGKYTTACKPGMKGKGIRGEFTVTAAPGG
jgi:iron uptake system component EfeO